MFRSKFPNSSVQRSNIIVGFSYRMSRSTVLLMPCAGSWLMKALDNNNNNSHELIELSFSVCFYHRAQVKKATNLKSDATPWSLLLPRFEL